MVNFNNAPEADYVYRYTTNTAIVPCVNESVEVTVTVTSCLVLSNVGANAPTLNPDEPTNFCDEVIANLNDYVVDEEREGAVLTWSNVSNPLQVTAHRSSNVTSAGTYYGFYFDDADADNTRIALVLY